MGSLENQGRFRALFLLLLAGLAGCTLIARFPSAPDADADDGTVEDSAPDAVEDSEADAVEDAEADAPVVDGEADSDREGPDADDAPDADVVFDADSTTDADETPETYCTLEPEEDFLWIFDFNTDFASTDGSLAFTDGTEATGCRELVPGRSGCGYALYFRCDTSWLTLEHRSEFDQIRGIDFMLLLDSTPDHKWGVLSRDATNNGPGHFTLYVDWGGFVEARIQTAVASFSFCSEDALELHVWHHIEIRLGEPQVQLWIDGERSIRNEQPCVGDPDIDAPYTLAGNSEPWVLGAACDSSVEGSAEPVRYVVHDLSIDHLRFWSVRPE